jgi:predicted PurR-regulated permease PerM
VGIVLLCALAAMALVVAIFIPPLVDQGDNLIEAAPTMVRDIQSSGWYRDLDRQFGVVDTLSNQAASLPGKVSRQLGTVLAFVAAGLFGAITILFLTIFLLLGGGQVVEGAVREFPRLAERRWWSIVQGAYSGIAAYVGGAIVIALIGGSVVTISAFALGLPYALPLGLWMMLLEIIPMVGATIGAIPAIVVAFASGGTVDGVIMIIVVVAYQQFESIIVQPRVQGKAASLTPLMVFLSVLIGSQLLGVLGALFAVPVAGVVQIFIRQLIHDQGSADVAVPALAPEELPEPPDIDDDGAPGVTGPSGTPL